MGKAYYNSAFEVLQKANKIKKTFYNKFFVTVNFTQISTVHHVIDNYNVKLINTDYKDSVIFEILVSLNDVEIFQDKMIEELKGDVNISVKDKAILI